MSNLSNAWVIGEPVSADDSVVPSSSPVAGPSCKTDNKEGSKKVLTAAQIRLKERTRRLVARKPSTSTPRKRKSGESFQSEGEKKLKQETF